MPIGLEGGPSIKETPYEKLVREPDFSSDPNKNPDKVLGLSYKATSEQLRRRYKELAVKHHPTTIGVDGSTMQKINVARDVFMEMRSQNLHKEFEGGDTPPGDKSLYELAATGASDAEIIMRQRYLREEIARQQNHIKDLTEAMLRGVGIPKDNPKEWTDFYTRTQDLSQRIENLTAELEARSPRKILHPDDGTVSPLHTEGVAAYEKFFGKR